MPLIKKLSFAPIFLIFLALCCYQTRALFVSSSSIFALSLSDFLPLIIFSGLLVLSAITFITFATLASGWKLVLPIIILASILPLPFLTLNLALVLAVCFLVIFSLIYFWHQQRLKSYINFSITNLLSPSIKALAKLLIVAIAFSYYLYISADIKQNGFELPDSIIEAALKISSPTTPQVKGQKIYLAQAITPEQLQFLKQNPDLLRQNGIDPRILDNLSQFQSPTTTPSQPTTSKVTEAPSESFIKNIIKSQFQTMLEPYKNYIAPFLAALFFVSLYSVVSLLLILLNPILWFIFYLLEKTGFITYTKELREVKKLVV